MKSDRRSPQFGVGHWLSGWRPVINGAPPVKPVARARKPAPRWPPLSPIFRGLYWCYRLLAWGRYSLPRRFDRAGLALAAALAVALVMLPDTENNVAYQAFSLILFTLAVGCCFAFFFPGKFTATRLLPRFGTVGCPLKYTVAVQNLGRQSQAGLSLLENLADPRPSFREWLEVQLAEERRIRSFRFSKAQRTSPFRRAHTAASPVPPLTPHGKVEVEVQLTPLRRGLLRLAGVTLARPDPLGLVRAFTRVRLPQSVLVLPRRYPLPSVPLPGALKYQQGGVALASNVGQSEEFVSLRDYRHGDPLRHIHWRSWARAGRPVVKEFEDEFFVRHALVLDTFAEHPRSPAFEEAVSIAASFACTIQTQESLLDLLFVGPESYCFTTGRGLAHADQMLEILAMVRACADQPFSSLEHLVLDHIQLVSGCVCVLLAWDALRRDFVRKLQALNIPLLVLVVVEAGESGKITTTPEDPERFYVLQAGSVEQGLANIK